MKKIWEKITAKIGKKYFILLVIAIVVLGALVNNIVAKKNSSAAALAQQKSIMVEKGNIEDKISGSGTIEAISRKEIASELTGTISKVYVTEGQQVKKGDLLMTFSNDTYDSQVQSAELSLQQAKAELASLQKDKTNLKIIAPSTGILGDNLPSVGSNVGQGSFSTITDQTHMQTRASFNLGADSTISVGQEVDLFIADYLTSIKGTVTSVSNVPTQGGNKICNVLITISNPGRLTSGTIVTVKINTANRSLTAIADTTLEWPAASNVQVKTAGTLKKIYVTANEWVNKGQLLAELESSDLDQQISNKIISVKQQQLSLNQQKTELAKRTLYAPIDGTVIAVNVTDGEEVTSNQADLITISCLNTLQVTIPVDELDILKVKMGQKANITSDAIDGKTFTAKVSEIAGEGTVTSGVSTFKVLLQLDDPGTLKAGMNVNAEILVTAKKDVLLIPIAAITDRGNRKFVKLQSAGSAGKLTEVKVGLSTLTLVEITSGLKQGEVVVYSAPVATATTSTTTKQQQRGFMGTGDHQGGAGGN